MRVQFFFGSINFHFRKKEINQIQHSSRFQQKIRNIYNQVHYVAYHLKIN